MRMAPWSRSLLLPCCLLASWAAAPRLAHADAVFTLPCPDGAREATSHAGPRCDPWTCTSDADCDGGRVCRPLRVCTQVHSVRAAGRAAFHDPPPPPIDVELVLTSCAPDARCDGSETPRAPTVGTPTGAPRCVVASYCARPALPSLATAPVAPTPPATTVSPPVPTQTPPVAAPPSTSTRANEPSPAPRGGLCVAGPGRRTGLAGLALLAVAALVVRGRRRRLAGALAVLTALLVVAPARAQTAPPAPWTVVRITPAPLFQTVALACGRDYAFARDSDGRVMQFDGVHWHALPAVPGDGARGSSLWVTGTDRPVIDAGRDLARFDGTTWTRVPVDAYFQLGERASRTAIDLIAGLGEAPWVAGRGAIGLVVEGHVRPFDAGPAWWPLADLLVLSRSDVRTAGLGGVLRFDGVGWSREATPSTAGYVDLLAFAPDDVWAAGVDSVAHWDGRAWTERGEGIAFEGTVGRRGGLPEIAIGGTPDALHLATRQAVYRLDATRWTQVIDTSMRPVATYSYGPICVTREHLVVGAGGHVLVRPLR
jgi:hypothetical protein